jgi:hypothetical protein
MRWSTVKQANLHNKILKRKYFLYLKKETKNWYYKNLVSLKTKLKTTIAVHFMLICMILGGFFT